MNRRDAFKVAAAAIAGAALPAVQNPGPRVGILRTGASVAVWYTVRGIQQVRGGVLRMSAGDRVVFTPDWKPLQATGFGFELPTRGALTLNWQPGEAA